MSKPALVETYAQLPFTLVEGHGARVRAADGREYWDLYGGHAVALIGHSHPAVSAALNVQAQRLSFYSNVAPLEIRTQAAEALCRFAPDGLEHVFFCNSGAEANENALKLAIQQTGRQQLAALEGAFHGRTLLALAVTGGEQLRTPFDGLLCPTVRLRPNVLADVAKITRETAAVIVEPIQSMAGVVTLHPAFLRALRQRCDETSTYLVYDEVQTGMGRLGRPFAAGELGVLPDLVTLAKGIANGVPCGAVLMTPAVAGRLGQGDLGSTFGGGPLACAALLAVLDVIARERLVEYAAELGRYMGEKLCVGPVREVIGRGCLIGLRLGVSAKKVYEELLAAGFITGTSRDPHVLRLLPPLNAPHAAFDELAQALLNCRFEERTDEEPCCGVQRG